MGRPKKPSAELITIEDANRALYALLKAEVELGKHVGAMDLARAEASARFELPIEREKTKILDLTAQLQAWYMANHKNLEASAGRKSVQLIHGIIGRRLGNPTLKPLNKSWTWAAIGVKLRSLYPGRFFNPRPEPTIDKDSVRAELTEDQLRDCGLKVDQEENFFVEPDRTKIGVEL